MTLYTTGWDTTFGTALNMPNSSGTALSTTPYLDPTTFFKPNLLGGAVEYDVDLSQRQCGCISAFYLVRSPAKDWNGNYANAEGGYYCDANKVGGYYCPEFDIMEAN
jgi:hypothetical protein